MDKKTFLETLHLKLIGLGVNEETVSDQINQFDRYFSILPDDEAKKQLGSIKDIDAIAQNICSLLKENKSQNSDTEDKQNGLPAADAEAEAKNTAEIASTSEFKAPPSNAEAYIPANIQFHDSHDTDNIYIDGEQYTAEQTVPVRKQTESVSKHHSREQQHLNSRYPRKTSIPLIDIDSIDYDYDFDNRQYDYSSVSRKRRREKIKGSPLFWGLFILTFPIWGTAILALYTLFFSIFAVLSVSIFVLILLLAGVVIAGAGLSLYGIIYGIIQTFTVMATGLFEIGLGVIIGGITMFSGILIYNFAIRLLPFVMKMLFRLLLFIGGKLGDLFYFIKKECSRI